MAALVQAFRQSAKEFSGGDLDRRFEVRSKGIVGALCESFNEMADHIQENFEKITTERLRKSEAKYRGLVETSQDLIWQCDKQGRLTYLNPAWEKVTGYKLKELLGHDFFGFQNEGAFEIRKFFLKKCLEGQVFNDVETSFIVKTGEIGVFSFNACRQLDSNGEPIGIQGTAYDITGRKQTDAQFEGVLGNIDSGFALHEMIYDDQGRPLDYKYLEVNPAFMRLAGVEDPTGKTVRQIYSNPEQCRLDIYSEILKTGIARNFQIYQKDLGKWWQVYGYKVAKDRFACIFYDITDLKECEEKLKKEVGKLQERVSERNAELELANKALIDQMGELHQYESKLRSLASKLTLTEEHERHRIASGLHDNIIQPLIFLDIKLNALLRGKEKSQIAEDAAGMKRTISELIKMTREFTFDLSYPILYELGLEAAVDEWLNEEIGTKNDIETVFVDDDSDKPLDNDLRVFLFEAVRELLVNVTKHSDAKKVEVDISSKDDIIEITVKDDGKGFDVNENLSRVGKDSGFGLFSVRERLSYFEGCFEIQSEPGKGTSVILKAPLKKFDREEEG